MAALRWGDVAVVVKDARAAARWWRDNLDFEPLTADGHWVTVAPKGSEVPLHLCEASAENPLEPGNTGIGFQAPDVARVEKELRAKGVPIAVPTTKAPWGTFLRFADPDGNEFWVNEG
jgi:catechol 2,3-dioxygenase-like lactoylglutathione lyase family enzyme